MRPVPNSLHDEVASRLREQIFGGALPPGSFLDEAALCERLEISRTPLREALKVLVAEGLLRHEPRRGCFFTLPRSTTRHLSISFVISHNYGKSQGGNPEFWPGRGK